MNILDTFATYIKHLEERIEKLEKLLAKYDLEKRFEGTPISPSMLPI
jgi:hypothetical protein|tara:strand:- start:53 stop:193 length:141 start_codon:yes stop_codon:yes gene_type:complete